MQNSKTSVFNVEIRFSNQWQQVAQITSPQMAQLKARLLATEYPNRAVRIREVNILTC